MYRCLGCGANLRFDIEKQLLKCDSCDSEYQVDEYDQKYKIEEESDIEGDEYQAYICTCPNCGGEIITNDENTIASYCSYCGRKKNERDKKTSENYSIYYFKRKM